ncbi:hypothetical protein BKA56DRAFT_687547 [Ilyonectria sp. MPI-CAGE-AT-0026]|nr:hypothetical protein BKA56DRAFT_687547 [Ilyonectria sp. MPI-CAGE-AT-0026]
MNAVFGRQGVTARQMPMKRANSPCHLIQEPASIREIVTLGWLRLAGEIADNEELMARLQAAQPIYSLDNSVAVALVASLRRLSRAPLVPDPDTAEEGKLAAFSCLPPPTLRNLLDQGARNPAPVVVVYYKGIKPSRRGASDHTPRALGKGSLGGPPHRPKDSNKNMILEPVLIEIENLLHYSSRTLLIKQTFKFGEMTPDTKFHTLSLTTSARAESIPLFIIVNDDTPMAPIIPKVSAELKYLPCLVDQT